MNSHQSDPGQTTDTGPDQVQDSVSIQDQEQTPRPPLSDSQSLIKPQSHTGGKKRGGKRIGAGRKKGVKNKKTLLFEAMTDFNRIAAKSAPAVFEALVTEAIKGEQWAVKLFMDKIVPNAQPIVETKGAFGGIQIVINDMKNPTVEGRVINGMQEEENEA